jgi:WD40 repeat protein
MGHKKLLLTMLAAVFILSSSACGASVADNDPADTLPGFRTDERIQGGTALENINADELSVSKSGTDTVLSFHFISGSRLSGGTEEGSADGVPAYTAYILPSPSRLVVEFEALAYWDFTHALETGDELIYGCFTQSLFGDERFSVYFQLKDDVVFKTEESGDSLSITLRPAPEEGSGKHTPDPGVRYYVTANAFGEYCRGEISRELDISPVLCRNLSDVVLISPAFAAQAEAENFKRSAAGSAEGLLPDQWDIIALSGNDLPQYNEKLDYLRAYDADAARIDGKEVRPEVVIPDGIYLCTTPDNSAWLYSKRIRQEPVSEGEEAFSYEELWLRDRDGSAKRMMRFEFSSIERTEYSPDGRKLAVLENTESGSHLYIFDTDTNELLTDLTETGFGNQISVFTFDNMGNIVYAVSGSGAMNIHQYDFSVPDESKRHTVVDKNGADEGYLAYCSGELYFTEADMEKGPMIYSIKPEGGVRKEFLAGGAFAVSPDNRFMAYSNAGVSSEANSFRLYDLLSGEKKIITSEFPVNDFFWSLDCKRVYYFENRLSGNSGESENTGEDESGTIELPALDAFPYTLYMYDLETGMSKPIADLMSTNISVSEDPDILFLAYTDPETMGEVVRATYLIGTGN